MQEIRFWVYVSIMILGIMIGVIRIKKLTTPFIVLIVLLALTVISEITAHYVGIKYRNNLFIYHVFTPLHFFTSCLVYYTLLDSKSKKRVVIVFLLSFLTFSAFNTFYIQTLKKFPTYSLLTESILLSIMAGLTFYEILQQNKYRVLTYESIFWFNSAIIIFYTAGFIFWGFHNYLVHTDKPLLSKLYIFLWWINIMMYSLFALSLMLDNKRKKIKHEP